MKLEKTTPEQIDEIVKISVAAFDSDTAVGSANAGGPPEYDSAEWHIKMMKGGHLYTATEDDRIIGAAILFINQSTVRELYIGRVFIRPDCFRRGYGTELMHRIEEMYADCAVAYLDTPDWNIRTNAFYRKLGYTEVKRNDNFIIYRKKLKYLPQD